VSAEWTLVNKFIRSEVKGQDNIKNNPLRIVQCTIMICIRTRQMAPSAVRKCVTAVTAEVIVLTVRRRYSVVLMT